MPPRAVLDWVSCASGCRAGAPPAAFGRVITRQAERPPYSRKAYSNETRSSERRGAPPSFWSRLISRRRWLRGVRRHQRSPLFTGSAFPAIVSRPVARIAPASTPCNRLALLCPPQSLGCRRHWHAREQRTQSVSRRRSIGRRRRARLALARVCARVVVEVVAIQAPVRHAAGLAIVALGATLLRRDVDVAGELARVDRTVTLSRNFAADAWRG